MEDKVPGKMSNDKRKATKNDNCGSIMCDPCYQDGDKKKTAEGFCVECQHYLCKQCFKYHRLPKPSRHHKLLGKSEMPRKKIDERLSEICSVHEGEMIKYYCKTHEVVGCNSCMIIDHKQCHEICTLVDIAKDVEQSILYKTFCTRIEETLTGLEDILNMCTINVENSEFCREAAIFEINSLQERVNSQFEYLKENIVKEAKEREEKDVRKIKEVEKSANNTKDVVLSLKDDFQILEKTKQRIQLFVALNKSKEKLQSFERKLKEIEETKTEVENKVEQYSFVPSKVLTDMLRLTQLGKLCMPNEIVQKDRLVVLDTLFNRILLLNVQTETCVSVRKLLTCPCDIAAIGENRYAVTMPVERKVIIMSIDCDMECWEIPVDATCESLNVTEENLYVTCSNPDKVLILDKTGTIIGECLIHKMSWLQQMYVGYLRFITKAYPYPKNYTACYVPYV